MWKEKTQKVRVSKDKREKERESSTTAWSMGENEGALWSKRTIFKRSSDEHRRVDNEVGSNDSYRM